MTGSVAGVGSTGGRCGGAGSGGEEDCVDGAAGGGGGGGGACDVKAAATALVGGAGAGRTVTMTGSDVGGGGGGCSCGAGGGGGGGADCCCGGVGGCESPKSVTMLVAAAEATVAAVEASSEAVIDAVTGCMSPPSPIGVEIAVVGGNGWPPLRVSAAVGSPVAVKGGSVWIPEAVSVVKTSAVVVVDSVVEPVVISAVAVVVLENSNGLGIVAVPVKISPVRVLRIGRGPRVRITLGFKNGLVMLLE